MTDTYRYIVGDTHGCIKTFRHMVEEKIQLKKGDQLYLLGDYIDRGPDCKGVLDYIMDLIEIDYSVFPLLGNHEDMFLKAPEDERYFQHWMRNGASSTLASFGLLPEIESLQQIPLKYIQFVEKMMYYASLEDFVLVHAGLDFLTDDPFKDKEAMLWSREFQYDSTILKKRKIIHGHTPVPLKEIETTIQDRNANLINLDGGCVYRGYPGYGNLVALNIDTWELYSVSNLD